MSSTQTFILGLGIGVLLTVIIDSFIFFPSTEEEYPTTTPCNCLSVPDMLRLTERYSVLLDSATYAPKKDRARYSDSVEKYKLILKIEN